MAKIKPVDDAGFCVVGGTGLCVVVGSVFCVVGGTGSCVVDGSVFSVVGGTGFSVVGGTGFSVVGGTGFSVVFVSVFSVVGGTGFLVVGIMVVGDSVVGTSVRFLTSIVVWTGVGAVMDGSDVVTMGLDDGETVTGSVAFSVATVLGAFVAWIVSLAVKTNRKRLM